MLDLNKEADLRAFEEAAQHAVSMQGQNFCLVMRNPDDTLSVYPRPNQPCQGGEMRKYKLRGGADRPAPTYDQTTFKVLDIPENYLHGGRCTRPNDPRPGDLRMPFPDGVVEACSKHFREPRSVRFLTAVFTSGPYHAAVKGFHLIRIKDDKAKGVVFTDTDVDPTLFVNMLQFINSMSDHAFDNLIKAGLTDEEAIVAMYLGVTSMTESGLSGVPASSDYYFSKVVSLPRLIRGKYNDLSGGTWRDGYDYNRPDVQDLYKAREDEVGTNFAKFLRPFFTTTSVPHPYYKGQTYETMLLSSVDFVTHFRALLASAETDDCIYDPVTGKPKLFTTEEVLAISKARRAA